MQVAMFKVVVGQMYSKSKYYKQVVSKYCKQVEYKQE